MMAVWNLLRGACLAGLMMWPTFAAAAPDCTDFADNHRLDSHDRQWCQALAFKDSYLKNGKFVEAPHGHDGKARDVSRRLSSLFSHNGAASVAGTVSIGELRGRFRLKLASTGNTLYYGRKIKITGTVSATEGRLEVYSHVDVDLWKLAAVLVDRPVRNQPPPQDGLHLKGYLITEIAPGPEQKFSANLIPIGGSFFLLLNAPDGTVRDIRIEIDDP